MNKYVCPCSNVTIEVPNDININNKDDDLNKFQLYINEYEDLASQLRSLFVEELLIKESYLLSKQLKSDINMDIFDSNLKIKYPLLTGFSNITLNSQDDDCRFKLSKCLVCNTITHCEFIQKKTSSLTDNEKTDSTDSMKSVLENKQFSAKTSSHSQKLPKSLDANSHFYFCVLVNSKRMLSNFDNNILTNDDKYSSVYDLILDVKKENLTNTTDMNFKINEVPIFEQRRFLNQIDEKYRSSQMNSDKEASLKQNFETLVNYLLNEKSNDSNDKININNKKSQSIITSTSITGDDNQNANVPELVNKIPLTIKKKTRKKYDENALGSSVFEMEEIDEFSDDEKFLNEQDSQDEELQNKLENQQFQKSILKKRNSNIGEESSHLNTRAKNMNFSKQNHTGLVSNQYSCSLPRDIPFMKNLLNFKSKPSQKDFDNNENYYNPVKEQQKHHNLLITNSYKQPNSNYLENKFNTNDDFTFNDDVDDELFLDNNKLDDEDNFELDNDDTANMGKAISTLASSIVIKDGRELWWCT